MTVLPYNPIMHNEPILKIQEIWSRPLTDHERNLVGLAFDVIMTLREVEEVKIVEVARHGEHTHTVNVG